MPPETVLSGAEDSPEELPDGQEPLCEVEVAISEPPEGEEEAETSVPD